MKVGTQPIIGTQINLKEQNIIGKVTLYAQSEEGYKNLTKLSSLSYLNNKETEVPSCQVKDLIDHNKDLILLTGNYRDFFGRLYQSNKLKKIDNEDTTKEFMKVIHVIQNHFYFPNNFILTI